jgi:hypothetical protein
VKLRRRLDDYDEHEKACLERRAALGLEPEQAFLVFGFGEREVEQFLKKRSPYVSIQSHDRTMALGCQTKVVYEFAVPEAGRSS